MNAELYAFGQRLSESFQLPLLQRAFIHKSYIVQETDKQKELGIENPSLGVEDNEPLVKSGEKLLDNFVDQFIKGRLANAPGNLQTALKDYLLSVEMLAKISKNIGTTDLILTAEFPVQKETLANTFKAIIGALAESSGEERANRFVYDFVCTHLNQLDYATLWSSENAFEELEKKCLADKLGSPEPRIIGSCGANTLLASYNVGIYCDKNMIGSGFGETVEVAISEASADALRGLYKIRPHQQLSRF